MAQTSREHIHQQLALLLDLQLLDNEIIQFEEERDEIPAQLKKLEGGLIGKRKQMEEKEHQINVMEDDMSSKNRALELERIKLKNTRNKEQAIQNLKQYEAYVKEVETQEKSSDELEEESAQLKQRTKDLRKDIQEIEVEIKAASEEQSKHRKELNGRLEELDKVLEELFDKRDDLAENLDEEVYLKYEYIAERKDGIAVAEVEHGHCMSCNMAIPPQMFNELIRGDKLMTCPACNRILVYKEKDEPAVRKQEEA